MCMVYFGCMYILYLWLFYWIDILTCHLSMDSFRQTDTGESTCGWFERIYTTPGSGHTNTSTFKQQWIAKLNIRSRQLWHVYARIFLLRFWVKIMFLFISLLPSPEHIRHRSTNAEKWSFLLLYTMSNDDENIIISTQKTTEKTKLHIVWQLVLQFLIIVRWKKLITFLGKTCKCQKLYE